jgi:hypothetical protein
MTLEPVQHVHARLAVSLPSHRLSDAQIWMFRSIRFANIYQIKEFIIGDL